MSYTDPGGPCRGALAGIPPLLFRPRPVPPSTFLAWFLDESEPVGMQAIPSQHAVTRCMIERNHTVTDTAKAMSRLQV